MWISSCKLAQPAAQFLPHLRVERAERLVEQQHFRFHGERAGERDALALAAGKLRRKSFGQRFELDELQQFFHAGADFVFRRPRFFGPDAQAERDVFKHAQVPEQRVMLKGKTGLALARGNLRHVLAVKQDLRLAGIVGKFQAGDDAQQRGLAGTGRAEQRDEFAGLDLEAHVVERGEAAEFFRDVLDFDAHVKMFLVPTALFSAAFLCSTHVFSASVTSARNVSTDATANAPVKLYSL